MAEIKNINLDGTAYDIHAKVSDTATKLEAAHTINGTPFDGTYDMTTQAWGTARNIYIQDAERSHIGEAVSVNGGAAAYLQMPRDAAFGNLSVDRQQIGNLAVGGGEYERGTISFAYGGGYITEDIDGAIEVNAQGVNILVDPSVNSVSLYNSLTAKSNEVEVHGSMNVSGDETVMGKLKFNTTNSYVGVTAWYLTLASHGNEMCIGNLDGTNTDMHINYRPAPGSSPKKYIWHAGSDSSRADFVVGNISATAFNQTSDERLKDISGDIELTTEQIAGAPSIEFAWKENGSKAVGTTAQYWQEVLPLAVHKGKDDMLSMQYDTCALLSAISNAKAILQLQAENKALREEIEQIKALINK